MVKASVAAFEHRKTSSRASRLVVQIYVDMQSCEAAAQLLLDDEKVAHANSTENRGKSVYSFYHRDYPSLSVDQIQECAFPLLSSQGAIATTPELRMLMHREIAKRLVKLESELARA